MKKAVYYSIWVVAGLGVCAGLGVSIGRASSTPVDYGAEIVSPGFLFVLAMCLWVLKDRKSMLPLQAIVFFLLLPILGGFCGTTLNFMDLAIPLKWDNVLYRIDSGLGVAPSWLLGTWLKPSYRVWQMIYQFWAIAVVVCWLALRVPYGSKLANRFLLAYAVNMVIGCSLYLIVPATGPIYAFPTWPNETVIPAMGLVPVAAYPNSIPSLHVSGAVILLLCSARVWWWRTLLALFVVGTMIATLVLGEHYLIDLVIAFPFARFAVSCVDRKWRRAGAFFGLVLSWLLAIRFFSAAMVNHPGMVWSMAGFTLLSPAIPYIYGTLKKVRWQRSKVRVSCASAGSCCVEQGGGMV